MPKPILQKKEKKETKRKKASSSFVAWRAHLYFTTHEKILFIA